MSTENFSPIAVVGTGCRFPGASSTEQFWDLIREAKTAISTVPASRLDRELYFEAEKGKLGKTYTQLAGLVEETPFDRDRYPIDPRLIESADSVHLRMLEVCWDALAEAKINPQKDLRGSRTGVYIGHTGGSTLGGDIAFGTLARQSVSNFCDAGVSDELPAELRERVSRNALASLESELPSYSPTVPLCLQAHDVATLVSKSFGLNGPSVALDAACASALLAVGQAVFALQRGHIDMAIAGGCSFSKWFGLVLFSQAQSVSPTGTRPFDKDADGLISSDGYAAVILKPLDKALADGSPILGVIRNVAIGSDGKGKSLWAPRKEGQIHTVRRAYEGEIHPSTLQYIECHATSTQVGDETELTALGEALSGKLPAGMRLPVGSVKGNIGHTLECAGIAGMLKTILALRKGVIPPQPSINQLNPQLPWDDVPFYVPTEAQAWPDVNQEGVRRAAVNAFGIGGLNSHVVIDDRPLPGRKRSSVPVNTTLDKAEDELVAVIGMGVIAPGSGEENEFWSLMSSGQTAISEISPDKWDTDLYFQPGGGVRKSPTKLAGVISGYEFDWKKSRIPPKQVANANPLQFMLLDAATQAFADAGYADMSFPKDRVSVIVGSVFGGDFACRTQVGLRLPMLCRELKKELIAAGVSEEKTAEILERYSERVLTVNPGLRDETGSFTASTLASRITKTFDLMGGAWAFDAASVSSLVGLETATDLLLTGKSDMVLCAAGQCSLDVLSFESFGLQGELSESFPSPAFDQKQDGNTLGEAVAVVLLKRLSDAERDGDKIRGVIRNVAVGFDCEDSSRGISNNLQRLLPADKSAFARIDAIETARLANAKMDERELRSLSENLSTQDKQIPLSSVSSQIGFSIGASGLMSVVKAVLQLEHQTVPPVAGSSGASENVKKNGRFAVNQKSQPLGDKLPKAAGRILVSNMDSNGAIAHVTIEGVAERAHSMSQVSKNSSPVASAEATTTDIQVVKVGATSMEQLAMAAAGDLANSGNHFAATDSARLGIIAADASSLSRKFTALKSGLPNAIRGHLLADNGIFIVDESHQHGRLACVFSGQGAQYSGMFSDWMEVSPAVRKFVEQADQILAELQLPNFHFLTQDEAAQLGTDVRNTQLAVLLGDLAAWAVLQEAGFVPDFVSGHSYGVYPALVAAGAWDLTNAINATLHRTTAVQSTGVKNAAMVSTTASAELVSKTIGDLNLACDIACYNSPDQTIIAGRLSDLDQLSEGLKAAGFVTRTIKVPMPYHSRFMLPAQPILATALEDIRISTPKIRFISCGSVQALETPEQIRAALVAELTDPVRWQTLVETLLASGTNVIVESGPRQILTRLNRKIIGERSIVHIAVDARPGHALEQQARIQMLLEMLKKPGSVAQPSAVSGEPIAETPQKTTPAPQVERSNGLKNRLENFPMTQEANSKGRIRCVDATERRRAKMRAAAQAGNTSGKPQPSGNGHQKSVLPTANGNIGNGNGGANGNGNGSHRANGNGHSRAIPESKPVLATASKVPAAMNAAAQPAIAIAPLMATADLQPAKANPVRALEREKLEMFVLDYVVEQTGYPPELVEMDADLEADLGIDSIRKAQLMGEIAETFELQHAASNIAELSLDDFPNLNRIIDFFIDVSQTPASSAAAAPTAATPMQAVSPAVEVAPIETIIEKPTASIPSASISPTEALPAAAAESHVAPQPIDRDELDKFIIQFVIEQTGYPEELVDVDADMEADLGIDSIRKAQLLGEIAENYNLTSIASQVSDMSLDDFPTLKSIADFFEDFASGQQNSAPTQAQPKPAAAAMEPVPAAVPATVASSAPAVPAALTHVAPLAIEPGAITPEATPPPSIQSLMSTADVTSTQIAENSNRPPAPSLDRDAVMAFAVNFIVEQTGYPEELVEPNVDLEADLGIDSIRKAQLLGEIAEHFQLTNLASDVTDMSLDDFPDLESITLFFCEAAGPTAEQPAEYKVDATSQLAASAANEITPNTVATSPATKLAASFLRVDEDKRLMSRYVMRSVSSPLETTPPAERNPFAGKLVILGEGADSDSLAQHMVGIGTVVEIIPTSNDHQTTIQLLEASWARQPIQHFIVMTSSGVEQDDWQQLRDQSVLTPYFVIQRWVQLRLEAAGKQPPAAGVLAAVTRMGGDFGIGGQIGNISGGALCGLFKGIARECPELQIKVVDAPADEPMRLVIKCLSQDLASDDTSVEVGCIRGQRFEPRMVVEPASTRSAQAAIAPGPWVLTGGARGITARIAAALGTQDGVQLHLIGRSPKTEVEPAWLELDANGIAELKKDIMRQAASNGQKPMDAWNAVNKSIDLNRTLDDLISQGLDVTYHACNVSSREAVQKTLDAVRSAHGPITGVIHGAGIEAASRFDRKKADSVVATVTAKVDSAMWLWELTEQDNLSAFVGFGSTSGRFGGLGQTDYSMASDMLCRLAWKLKQLRPGCRTFGVHWPPWDEIGMAARPESRFALEAAGLSFLSPDEGISHLLDEIQLESDNAEVVFVDQVMGTPDDVIKADQQLKTLLGEVAHVVYTNPLIDSVIACDEASLTLESVFDPKTNVLMLDHVYDGIPVVPGTVLLELCLLSAGMMPGSKQIRGISDFTILNGVRAHGDQPIILRTEATSQLDGSIDCKVIGQFRDRKNRVVDPRRIFAEVTIQTAETLITGQSNSFQPGNWEVLSSARDTNDYIVTDVGTVYHGPSLDRLKRISKISETESWFEITAPQDANFDVAISRPAILDAILQGIDVALHRSQQSEQLPESIGQLAVHQELADQNNLVARVVLTRQESDLTVWTVDCFDQSGAAVVSLENVAFRQLKRQSGKPAQANPVSRTSSRPQRPMLKRASVKIDGSVSEVTIPLDPAKDSFLSEHLFQGTPLLPAVMAIELMGEAAESLANDTEMAVSISNMDIHAGMRFTNNKPMDAILKCRRNGGDVYVELYDSSDALKMSSIVRLATAFESLDNEFPSAHGELGPFPYPDDAPVFHGPAFRTLRTFGPWRFQGNAVLQSEGESIRQHFDHEDGWLVPPAILDGAFVACGTDGWLYYGHIPELPDGFDKLTFNPPPAPGDICEVAFQCTTREKGETTTYDLKLRDSTNRVFLIVHGYRQKRISATAVEFEIPE